MRKEEEKHVGASQRSPKGVLSGPRQTRGDNGALEAESEEESSVSGQPARLAIQPHEGACRLGSAEHLHSAGFLSLQWHLGRSQQAAHVWVLLR